MPTSRNSSLIPAARNLVFGFALVLPVGALAQDTPDCPEPPCNASARAEALDLFERGVALYGEGNFQAAAELMEEAYELHPEPILLYNLGRAYGDLGEHQKAINAYRSFLEQEPEAEDREVIEQRIESFERELERRREEERLREEAERNASVPEEASPSVAPWVIAGTGLVTVGVGAVLGVMSGSARSSAEEAGSHESAAEDLRRAEDFATVANVSLAVGGAVALLGIVWGVVDVMGTGSTESEEGVALRIGPASLSMEGRF